MSHLHVSNLFTKLVTLTIIGLLATACTDRPTWHEMRIYDAPSEQIDIPIDNCAGEYPLNFGYGEGRKLERQITSSIEIKPSIGISLSPEQIAQIGASVSAKYGYENRTTKGVEVVLTFSTTVAPHKKTIYTIQLMDVWTEGVVVNPKTKEAIAEVKLRTTYVQGIGASRQESCP